MPDNITPQDQFEQDIEFIRTTDKVLGDPPGTTGVLSGPINKVLQKIVNSLLNLKTRLDGLTITVPNATTTVKGIAELATKQEAENGQDTTRIIVAKRVYDILKHANAGATTSKRGTVELATEAEAQARVDAEKAVTPLTLHSLFATNAELRDHLNLGANGNKLVDLNSLWRLESDAAIAISNWVTESGRYTSIQRRNPSSFPGVGQTRYYFGPFTTPVATEATGAASPPSSLNFTIRYTRSSPGHSNGDSTHTASLSIALHSSLSSYSKTVVSVTNISVTARNSNHQGSLTNFSGTATISGNTISLTINFRAGFTITLSNITADVNVRLTS